MLSAIGSPIATGYNKFTVPDLIVAAKCCSARYGERQSLKPTLKDVFWTLVYNKFPDVFKKHSEVLFKWIGIQSSQPKYWRSSSGYSSGSKIDRSPRCLGLACSLMSRAGFTRHDAWNTPVGEAQWIDAQIAKLEGVDLNFLDDEDLVDDPVDFGVMTDEEVLAQFKRDLPTEDMAIRSFEHWKKLKGTNHA